MTQEQLVERLLEAPEKIIGQWDLEYVYPDQLGIYRIKKGRGFAYKKNGEYISEKNHLTRIKKMGIPPAWNEVWISEQENGHIQAIGKDGKNRKQYIYHPKWVQLRNGTKFYRMVRFGKLLPLIRKQVGKDLRLKGWPREKVIALVVSLMEETNIRIGSRQYALDNQTYGLSTLRKKHVQQGEGKIRFEFVGKKGKQHRVTLRNKKLVRLVNRCEEIPGWELFKYYDEGGTKRVLDSCMVNQYLNQLCGEHFTAKDFRTWAASVIFFDTVKDLGPAPDPKEAKRNTLLGLDAAAAALGNTRNICRKHYVHPLLISTYTEGSPVHYFNMVDKMKGEQFFSPSEQVLLALLEKEGLQFPLDPSLNP